MKLRLAMPIELLVEKQINQLQGYELLPTNPSVAHRAYVIDWFRILILDQKIAWFQSNLSYLYLTWSAKQHETGRGVRG